MAVKKRQTEDGSVEYVFTGLHAVPLILLFIPVVLLFLSFGLVLALAAGVLAAFASAWYFITMIGRKGN